MSQRQSIEARLRLYGELNGILGAMRNFALAELHRVSHREESQQEIVGALSRSLSDLAPFRPPHAPPRTDVWLLLGSVRGFCGSFNEDVVRCWESAGVAQQPVITIGERLASAMPPHVEPFLVAGAEGGLDAASAVDRILEAFASARRATGQACGLVACLREEEGARTQRLLPLPLAPAREGVPPLTNEPPAAVAAGVAEHYLFHQMLALLLRSIRVENHQRLMQMENALRHLEQGSEALNRQRNRLRQEEIVEEIEVMTGIRRGLHEGMR